MAGALTVLSGSVAVSLLLLELGTRVVFAFDVGPRVLLYGLADDRDVRTSAIPLPFRWDQRVAIDNEEKRFVDTPSGTYSKYLPNQDLVVLMHGEHYKPRINRFGFRGEDVSKQKPEDVIRVIALGASSTFGYQDRDDETYPYYLEQDLNASAEATDGARSFEVLNFGIPHLDSAQILALFSSEALDFEPDVVTFYEGVNDTRRIERRPAERLLIQLGRYSLFLRFVEYALTERLESFSGDDVRFHSEGRGEAFVRNVSRIADVCARRGILFMVVSQQAKSKMVPDEQMDRVSYWQEVDLIRRHVEAGNRVGLFGLQLLIHAEINRQLRQWVRANDIAFVDMIHEMDEAKMRHTLVSWVHLSAEGNRFIAAELSKAILSELATGPRR